MSEHAKVLLFVCGVLLIGCFVGGPLVAKWWAKRRAAEIAKVRGNK